MSKTLVILRHGKSDWGSRVGGDHERSLKPRGQKAAVQQGEFLAARGITPDKLFCSSAVRTRETAALFLAAGDFDPQESFERALYLTEATSVIAHLAGEAGDADVCLLVNHEPTCSALIDALTGEFVTAFPTAAMACIELQIEAWSELRAGVGSLSWVELPR